MLVQAATRQLLTDGLVQQYMQCGGKGYDGPTKCTTELSCERVNEYHSQCLRSTDTPQYAQQWEQCGGEYHTGPTKCAEGLSCVVANQWYSQCLQGASEVRLAAAHFARALLC